MSFALSAALRAAVWAGCKGGGAAAAIALCDEQVTTGPPPGDTATRFGRARSIAAAHGVHLVDWIVCDDQHP